MKKINKEHFIRQRDLINAEKLDKKIIIIGAGGIGSWTALALLKMGCINVTVLDFDGIEEHNLGSQIYNTNDIGKEKVNALKDKLVPLVSQEPQILNKKWTPSFNLTKYDIVISAVDSITVRGEMFNNLIKNKFKGYFIDGRMAANEINLYCINIEDKNHIALYKDTLFKPEEALPIPCSARAVIYNCFVISGLIADCVAQIVNKNVQKQEIIVDLMNLTMN